MPEDITRKRSRERLAKRREPYWHRLSKGAYLGFRRGPDTWILRFRNRDGKQVYQALKDAREFDEAKVTAEELTAQLNNTAVRSARLGTVREGLETYLRWLKEQGREDTVKTCKQRFEAIVWSDPLADIPLPSLTREDMRAWRDRLRDGRQPQSINRHVRSITAALNRAHKEGHVGFPSAWDLGNLTEDNNGDEGESAVFLTPEQRNGLIEAASPAGGAFFCGLALTGARPGELAKATVVDFDASQGEIKLTHRKGKPPIPRARIVVLSEDGAKFFKKQARRKAKSDHFFVDGNGKPWDRFKWRDEINDAIVEYNKGVEGDECVPSEASAYSFRHTRISELLQVHGFDPLTVAQQTGTSVKMIEKYYFKFIPTAMRDKLRAIQET